MHSILRPKAACSTFSTSSHPSHPLLLKSPLKLLLTHPFPSISISDCVPTPALEIRNLVTLPTQSNNLNNGLVSKANKMIAKGNQGGDEMKTAPFALKTRRGDNDCLGLLIEAAKLVFAEDESNSEEASHRTGALEEAVVKKDDTSSAAVVRSKRGRTQALPYRFRDSVMEPLKRSGRSSKRRSRGDAAAQLASV